VSAEQKPTAHPIALRKTVTSVLSVAVDDSEVSRWFAEYLDVFAACG
jgi:hypothetical protein